MTRDEVADCINGEMARLCVPRTHDNAKKVLSSLLAHLDLKPETELTAALIRVHAEMVLVCVLTAEFTN